MIRCKSASIEPDVTIDRLRQTAQHDVRTKGAIPSFYGGFPIGRRASINDELVHGVIEDGGSAVVVERTLAITADRDKILTWQEAIGGG